VSTLTFKTVNLGDEIPTVTRHVDQEMIWRNAAGSLDYNPVHTHPEWCQTAKVFGLESTVAHGMMTMAFMATALTDWAYSAGGTLKKMETKFIKPVVPGDVIATGGTVTEKHVIAPGKNYVVLDIWAENQDGAKVAAGEGEVNLPD